MAGVVIANGTDEMVFAMFWLAITRTQHRSCLNPMSSRSTVLSGLAWHHANGECLGDGKDRDGR